MRAQETIDRGRVAPHENIPVSHASDGRPRVEEYLVFNG
jgi:hypothetical protein